MPVRGLLCRWESLPGNKPLSSLLHGPQLLADDFLRRIAAQNVDEEFASHVFTGEECDIVGVFDDFGRIDGSEFHESVELLD